MYPNFCRVVLSREGCKPPLQNEMPARFWDVDFTGEYETLPNQKEEILNIYPQKCVLHYILNQSYLSITSFY